MRVQAPHHPPRRLHMPHLEGGRERERERERERGRARESEGERDIE